MKRLTTIAVSVAMIWLCVATAQQAQQKKPVVPAKKAAAPAARPTAPAKKGTTSSTAARRTGMASRTATASKKGAPKKQPVATWRNRQTVPSTERYREIQGALASRGYLRAEEATGTWNQSSIDALKRFQQEQNLESTGKINSLSLIALGLGPKRDAAPAVVPAPQVQQVPEGRPPSQ